MKAMNEFTIKPEKEEQEEQNIMTLIDRQEKIKHQKQNYEAQLTELDKQREKINENFKQEKQSLENERDALNSKIYELQGQREKVDREIAEVSSQIELIETTRSEQMSKWGQIVMAIKNLYLRAIEFKDVQ